MRLGINIEQSIVKEEKFNIFHSFNKTNKEDIQKAVYNLQETQLLEIL